MRQAYIDWIDPSRVVRQHGINPHRVDGILQHLGQVDGWDLPPVLVVENDGNGYIVLDGHHRAAAAVRWNDNYERAYSIDTIPAWVISIASYCAILEEHFDGYAPARLADLREYIDCGGVDGNHVCGHGEHPADAMYL